jgi:hypothetical protein
MIAGEARRCGNTFVLSARGESVRARGKAGVSARATQSMKPRKAPKVSELETEMAKTQGRGSVDRFHAISSTEWFRITE